MTNFNHTSINKKERKISLSLKTLSQILYYIRDKLIFLLTLFVTRLLIV